MVQKDLVVSAVEADRAAAARGYAISAFMTRIAKATNAACPWQLIGFANGTAQEQAAVAWTVADKIMLERAGHSRAYQLWRDAALSLAFNLAAVRVP